LPEPSALEYYQNQGPLFFKKIQNNENEAYFSDKLVITPDGTKALTYKSSLVLWDLETCENTLLNDINHPCYAADISPDGKWALTSDMGTITLWDLVEGKAVKTIVSPNCYKIIIRPDMQRAAAVFDSQLKIYDLPSMQIIKEISARGSLHTFSCTPDFKTAVWFYNNCLVVYDLETDKIMKMIPGKGMLDVDNTMISSDKSKVLDFRYQKMNFLWDIQKGELIGKIGDGITDVTPDFILAIAGYDAQGELFDISRLESEGMYFKAKKIRNINLGPEMLIKDSKITSDGKKIVFLDHNSNLIVVAGDHVFNYH
jgi:WD40 repeat protein